MQTNTSIALKSIRKQFLCRTPLNNFNWHVSLPDNLNINFFGINHFKGLLHDLSLNTQQLLLANTVNYNLVIIYPLKISYQKAFVKVLLDKLIKQNAVIDDGVYEAYGRLVALDESMCCYKHFELNEQEIVTLIEKSAFISEGTTGLATWEVELNKYK